MGRLVAPTSNSSRLTSLNTNWKAKHRFSRRCFHFSSTAALPNSRTTTSGPILAIVKEYVATPSSRKETATGAVAAKIRVKSTSGEGDGAPEGGKVILTKEELPNEEAEPSRRDEDLEASKAASHFSVFVAAPPQVTASSISSTSAQIASLNERFEKVMVELDSGSAEERIVKAHGLAALSYTQAYELVAEANGISFKPAMHAGEHNSELDDPPMKVLWDENVSPEVNASQLLPPEPTFIVRQMHSIWNSFKSAFLPTGWPNTVSPDYEKYYRYMFLQNVAGSFSYVMSMTALLQAVGIGSGAIGAAAAVSWVMKDGLGAVGMIFAAKVLGDANTFDANTIRSKFKADLVHNLGVSLELLTLLFPGSFLLLASAANTLKGVAGLVNGACKASINQRMAIANNLGDLTAKGHVQGLAAYLTGLSLGVLYDRISPTLTKFVSGPFRDFIANTLESLGSADLAASFLESTSSFVTVAGDAAASTAVSSPASLALVWPLFLLSASLHLFCSYRALRSLALPSLNQERAHLLISKFIDAHPIQDCHTAEFSKRSSSKHEKASQKPESNSPDSIDLTGPANPSQLPTPFDLSREGAERIILPSTLDSALPRVVLGASVKDTFQGSPNVLQPLVLKSMGSPYMIHGDTNGSKVWVVLSTEASPRNMLKSFFHACAARRLVAEASSPEFNRSLWEGSRNEALQSYVDHKYPYFEAQLETAGWRLDQILLTPHPTRADWTLSAPPTTRSSPPNTSL